ncbi:hypothetical protein TNCT_313781, partial [Trichonephila clavata]
MEWPKCDICNKFFHKIAFLKVHEASEKHKRKEKALKLNITDSSKPHLKGYIKCFDCNIICNGLMSYELHLQGKIHKITIEAKLYNVQNNPPLPSPNSALNPMEWNSETLQKYYCDICKKQCDSANPYDLHVSSNAHRKKVQNEDTIIRPPFPNQEVKGREYNNNGLQLLHVESTHQEEKPDYNSNTIESSKTHLKCYEICVHCNKVFNGPKPYEHHLQSERHKKKIGKKIVKNVEIDSLLPATDSTLHNSMECNSGDGKKYYCDICKKQCDSANPYDLHVSSNAHRKKVQNEDTIIRPPFPNQEVKGREYNNNGLQLLHVESTHQEEKPDYNSNTIESSKTHLKCYEICVHCNKVFNGPKPYEHHLQSERHKKKIGKKIVKNVEIDSLLPATDSTLHNSMECNSGDGKKYYCDICKKQCDSANPCDLHVSSNAPRKKVQNVDAISRLPFPNQEVKGREYNNDGLQLFHVECTHQEEKPDYNSNTIESSKTHLKCYEICVHCDEVFNGPKPYEHHLQSERHKKKIEKKNREKCRN